MKSEKKPEDTLSRKKEGLSKAARDLLGRVRASPSPEAVYGLAPAAAEAKAHSVIDPLIEDTGLPVARLNQYRWYLADLCRLMRTRSGPDLAYCMEYALKKWLSFGLEPNSVVVLATELFERLRPQAETEGNSPPRHQDTKRSDGGETAKDAKSADCVDVRLEPQNPGTPGPGTAGSVPMSGGGGP